MKATLAILLLILLAATSRAQYRAIDSVALAIPSSATKTTDGIARYINTHFATEDEKVRAAFIWVASTFSYDVPNMYALKPNEKPQDKITKPLATHKGICENYAAVFNDVCKKIGVTSYIIPGYTRKNGQASNLPHAWCAAKVNGAWYLYDPTWAAGYVLNNKFVPRINEAWYKVSPTALISSHIPFDPMWQLLHYPVTNQEFADSLITENSQKQFFSYEDSITTWLQQNDEQRLVAVARRIEGNGNTTQLIDDHLKHIKMELEYINSNKYNASVTDFNKAAKFLNNFITYRNHQFTPTKPDKTIQSMLDSAGARSAMAHQKMNSVKMTGNINAEMMAAYQKAMVDFRTNLEKQKAFLSKYLSTPKPARKELFFEQ